MLLVSQTSVANAAVGRDLLEGNPMQTTPFDRVVEAIAVTGSAVAMDTIVEVFVGSDRVGIVRNTAIGAPNTQHLYPLRAFVPASVSLHCYVVQAPVTNPINLLIDFEDFLGDADSLSQQEV